MSARIGVSHPLIRSGALALVSVATAFAFARVFSDARFVPVVVGAAVIPHAVGAVARLRKWRPVPTIILASVATGAFLVWMVAASTTAYGFPTPATARRVAHLVDGGWQVFRVGIAPVRANAGVVLLCAIVVAVAAIVADAVARRPEVTLAALAPTLVVFVLVGTLGSDHLRYPTTIAYIAAALAELAIANTARVEAGRTWFTGRRLASDAAVVRSAAAVGGIALLIALVITPLIPGVDNPPLLRYRNSGGAGGSGFGDYTSVSPLVDLRARLRERSDVELFRVQSPQRLPWRLVALDEFNGTTWSLTSEARDTADAFPPGEDEAAIRQKYSISSLSDRWIPAAFTPVSINLANARAVPASMTLVSPTPITGLDYEVRSRIEAPVSPAEIGATARRVPPARQSALTLPDGFAERYGGQVEEIVRGATTPWEQAKALERFFTDGSFVYDLEPKLGDGVDAIDRFLETRRGFCQQFAATFAAFGRVTGLPTRVAVGFTAGAYDEVNDEYVVRGRDAHAWVEVWFAGLGWRTFEPTPAGLQPGQADPSSTPGGVGVDPGATTSTSTPPATAANPNATPGATPQAPKLDSLVTTSSDSQNGRWATRTLLLIAVLGAVALGAAAVIGRRMIRPWRIRSRRRRAPVPAERIAGAWRDSLDTCAASGLPISAMFTPNEQVRSLERHGVARDALPPLRDLADLHAEHVFSRHRGDADASARAWAAADAVRDALHTDLPKAERARRLVRASFHANPVDRTMEEAPERVRS